MTALAKARLAALDANNAVKDEVDVQFNPTSLALTIANKTDSTRTKGQQSKQYLGKTATQMTLELVFDTADESTGEGAAKSPVNVRDKTFFVEKFVLPIEEGKGKQAPPKLRFVWGKFIFTGMVDEVSLDIDLFAPDGTPLRAKVKLTVREQDAKWEHKLDSKTDTPPAAPGAQAAASPGAPRSAQAADRVAQALAGEAPPEFAARVGVDPAAWRGLAAPDPGLSLEAGALVGFRDDLAAAPGIGASAGATAGVDASLEVRLGLTSPAGGLAGGAGGFALAAAGGLEAALASAADTRQSAAVAAARAAFAAPASTGSAPPVDRAPLRTRGRPSAPPVPPPPPDPRAACFGRGVPLRDRFRGDLIPDVVRDPTRPSWQQLAPPAAAATPAPTRGACRCACACTCKERR
jgi:hypothetical protein